MDIFGMAWKSAQLRMRLGRRRKLSSLVAIIAIAIGIASTVTSLAALRAMVFDIYPYPDLDRLVAVGPTTRFQNNAIAGTGVANYLDIRERVKSYSDIGYGAQSQQNLGTDHAPERIRTMYVTPSMFRLFGARPVMGRVFSEDDAQPGRDDVAVITYRAWQNLFGSDPAILTRVIRLDNKPYRVVGVLAPDMYFVMKSYQVLTPFVVTDENRVESKRTDLVGTIYARLGRGVTLDAARGEIRQVREEILRLHPELKRSWNAAESSVTFNVDTLRSNTFRFGTMWIIPVACYSILGLSVLVLLLCGLNLITMMLAETGARIREFAIRSSVGASRRQIGLQLVFENIFLYVIGAIFGIFLAQFFIGAMRRGIESNEVSGTLHVDWRVAGLGIAIALVMGVLSGSALAQLFVKPQPIAALQATATGSVGPKQRAVLALLIVGQLAVAFALLACASLMRSTAENVMKIDPGFTTKDVLVAKVEFPDGVYPTASNIKSSVDRVVARLGQLPGVAKVAASAAVPFNGGVKSPSARLPAGGPETAVQIREYDVTDNYLEALEVPLRTGRYFTPADAMGTSPSVIIDQALADRFFAGRNPVGADIAIGERVGRIIGVVGVVKHQDFREQFAPGAAYFLFQQTEYPRTTFFVLKTHGGGGAMSDAVRKAILETEPLVPRFDVAPVDEQMQFVINVRERMISNVLGLCGAMATFLAMLGSYGLVSFLVEWQTRDFAIRLALGATPAIIMKLVLRMAGTYVAWGLGLGAVVSVGCAFLMGSLLYGTSPWQPAPYVSAGLLLTLVAAVAVVIPCIRAMRTAPMKVLKEA